MNKKTLFWLILSYFGIRVFSYFFSPSTPLYSANPVNAIVGVALLAIVIYFFVKRDERAWFIIAGEILLGGGGGYLEIGGISLRTLFLFTSILFYFFLKVKYTDFVRINSREPIPCLMAFVIAISFLGAMYGMANGHNLRLIYSDFVPYLFLFYFFPLRELLQSQKFIDSAKQMLAAAVIGNFIFILLTFFGFSSGSFVLQDSYYHWFRDVAGGKITELPFNYFRLILNEHLLLIPILLFFLRGIIYGANVHNPNRDGISKNMNLTIALSMLLLLILTVNLTRIYLVALIVGLLFLFSRSNWRRWLLASVSVIAFFFASFMIIHLSASRGQSLGAEIFGLRLESIVSPGIEGSSLSRMLSLPVIWKTIAKSPLFGSGLGESITVYNEPLGQIVTTPHFDWGYLELWSELGMIGILAWFVLYLAIIWRSWSYVWQRSAIFSLLIINLTSPAIFHVFGIIIMVVLLATISWSEPDKSAYAK